MKYKDGITLEFEQQLVNEFDQYYSLEVN